MRRRYVTAAVLRDLDARLTDRDLRLLRFVSDLRFMSGDQLRRLCFSEGGQLASEARSARRALARLTAAQLLARLPRSVGGVRSGSAGFVYYLGLAGRRLAIERGWRSPERIRQPSAPGTLFLKHTLLVTELHTRLIEAARRGSIDVLDLDSEPTCWRPFQCRGRQLILKPDSYVRLGVGAFEDSYFVEIDRGTEGSRTIERQLRLYAAHHLSGIEQTEHGVYPKVLWLATSPERIGVIGRAIDRLPMANQALFQAAHFEAAIAVMSGETP